MRALLNCLVVRFETNATAVSTTVVAREMSHVGNNGSLRRDILFRGQPACTNHIHEVNDRTMLRHWAEYMIDCSGSLVFTDLRPSVQYFVFWYDTKQQFILSYEGAVIGRLSFAHVHCVSHPCQPRREPLGDDSHSPCPPKAFYGAVEILSQLTSLHRFF